MNEIITFAM